MISYQIGTIRYQIKSWKFPAGEVGCQIQAHSAAQKVDEVRIVASIQSSDELMQLFMVTDALRRQFYNARIELWLGYTPYGRQDRVCNDGEFVLQDNVSSEIESSELNWLQTIFENGEFVKRTSLEEIRSRLA